MAATMNISTGEEMNPSKRNTMEDSSVVLLPGEWKSPDPNMTYLAVHDGHGGRDIVNFLDETLHNNVALELLHHTDDATIEQRLERAFLLTDIQSKQFGLETSGATVAVCLISQNPFTQTCTITSANVGDARVIVGKSNGMAVRLSYDHRADDGEEVQRIQQAGGFCLRNRVTGILAVSRALGDHGLKDFVTARPHVATFTDTPSDKAQVVIVACDGLFDVMSDQEVVNFAMVQEDREHVAQRLCKEAIARGSTDNVTAIVLWL